MQILRDEFHIVIISPEDVISLSRRRFLEIEIEKYLSKCFTNGEDIDIVYLPENEALNLLPPTRAFTSIRRYDPSDGIFSANEILETHRTAFIDLSDHRPIDWTKLPATSSHTELMTPKEAYELWKELGIAFVKTDEGAK